MEAYVRLRQRAGEQLIDTACCWWQVIELSNNAGGIMEIRLCAILVLVTRKMYIRSGSQWPCDSLSQSSAKHMTSISFNALRKTTRLRHKVSDIILFCGFVWPFFKAEETVWWSCDWHFALYFDLLFPEQLINTSETQHIQSSIMKALILFCPGYSPPNIVTLTIGRCVKKIIIQIKFICCSIIL